MAASTHTGDRGSREEAQGAAPSSLPSEWPCLPRTPPVAESHAVMLDRGQDRRWLPSQRLCRRDPEEEEEMACEAHAWREESHCPPGPDAADRAGPLPWLPPPLQNCSCLELGGQSSASLPQGSNEDRGFQDVSETLCCSIPGPGQTGPSPAWRGCPCSSTPPLPGWGPYRCQRSGKRCLFADKIFSASYLQDLARMTQEAVQRSGGSKM